MGNPFRQFANQFHKYSRSDRNALLILCAIILVLLAAKVILNNISSGPDYDSSEYEKIFQELEAAFSIPEQPTQTLFTFNPNTISQSKLDSLDLPPFVKRNMMSYRKAGGKFYSGADFRKLYGMNDSVFALIGPFIEIGKKPVNKRKSKTVRNVEKNSGYFDPNTVSFDELKQFGFNNYQANNLLNYRKSGGIFKNVCDVLKIYGVDSVFFATIKSKVKIDKQFAQPEHTEKNTVSLVELNSADSAGLVVLKGIGPVYASRILKYRKLLGGFYSKKQLLEVYNFPVETFKDIEGLLSVDSTSIQKIRINYAEFSEMLRHPYLNKNQVKGIIKYRDENGAYENIVTLQHIAVFDSVSYSKIKHYITCR